MIEIEGHLIQQYRCEKMNLSSNQVEIDSIEKLKSLLNTYIGLHSARIGRVYISLFSKGLNIPIDDVFTFFNSKEIIKLRSFRTTLHKCTKDLSKVIHRSTLKRKTTVDFRNMSISDWLFIKKSLDKIYGKQKRYSQTELEDNLIYCLNMSRDQSKRLIYNLWNNGTLTVLNESEILTKEKRKFTLFNDYYGFDINDFSKTEQNCIDETVMLYIRTFGPVTINDIAWWSGFSISEIQKALKKEEDNITKLKVKEISNILYLSRQEKDILRYYDEKDSSQSWARFLSFEDSAIKAYYETRFLFSPNYKECFNKIGEVYSTVICDGLIVGMWSYKNQKIDMQLNTMIWKNKEIIYIEKDKMEKRLGEIYGLIIKH